MLGMVRGRKSGGNSAGLGEASLWTYLPAGKAVVPTAQDAPAMRCLMLAGCGLVIVRRRAPSYRDGNTRPGGSPLSALPARRYGVRSSRSLVTAERSAPCRVRFTGAVGGRTVRSGPLISRGIPLGTAVWNSGRLATARECVFVTGPAQARARLSTDRMPITIAIAGLVASSNRRPAGNTPVRSGGSLSHCVHLEISTACRHFD